MRIKFILSFILQSLRVCFEALAFQKLKKKLAQTTKTETCFEKNYNDT